MAVQSSKYEVFKIKSSNGEREVDLIDGTLMLVELELLTYIIMKMYYHHI